jgi:hypothetical protein
VGIGDLIEGVSIALGLSPLGACPSFDRSGDGIVEIADLIAAVNAALDGCPVRPTPTATQPAVEPTPTATPPATLDEIQQTIFSPRCAVVGCHDASGQTADLILEPGRSYMQLVGVPPSNGTAVEAGLLRVDPGYPDNSFLVVKLAGPAAGEGGQMPLGGAPLTPAELALVQQWIADGAQP